MKQLRVLFTDIAGVCLIILSILTGWIPGPGGIPLFLGGLGLLALNHEWARKLLVHVKTHGVKAAELFFKEHKLLMLAYDFVAIALVTLGIVLIIRLTGVIQGVAIGFIFIGLGLFFGNRKRLQRLTKKFRNKP